MLEKVLAAILLLPVASACHSGGATVARAAPTPGDGSRSVARTVTRLDGRTLSPQQVSATVERLMAAARVPGLALAILNHGEIVYLRGFGYRDVEQHLPLTDSTIMYAASFTKAMFAYMVAQLIDSGILDPDKPIQAYLSKPLPEYPKYAELAGDARYERITARMLLTHTSGLPNWRFFNPDGRLDIKFDPGTRYSYSGEGINLLQFVLEAGIGLSVDSLMRERVFRRFGMTRTAMTWSGAFESNYANGYDEQGKSLGHKRREAVRAAGSADSPIADVARFVEGVFQGAGLSRAGRERMLSPQVRIRSRYQFPTPSADTTSRDDAIRLSYGMGWGLFWSPYGKAYFKEGHDDGWEHYMISFDAPKAAIVIMTNSSNGESIFTELLATLIGDTFTPSEWERYTPYDRDVPAAPRSGGVQTAPAPSRGGPTAGTPH